MSDTERKCPTPGRHHIERAVKSRLFSVGDTVDYVVEKIDEAYEKGLADAERRADAGSLFPEEDATENTEDPITDAGK